jgi:3-hydroxyisobutyrate dehydrogenase and related beta-hydroxyacid dehydrogenases
MKVGFIGLGNMGAPMARNLIRAGHDVTVFNRTRAKAEPLAADGARVADSVAHAVSGCEVAVTMLADDQAVQQAIFGVGGMLPALPPGAVHMSTSTISVEMSKALAMAHTAAGQGYIATPVLGRPEAAAARKLWVIAAGPPSLVERSQPLIAALGRGVTIVGGDPWQANVVKLASNFMIVSLIETLGEAFALLRKAGISIHQFLEIANPLFGSPVFEVYSQLIADEKYEPAGFRMKLGMKDVRLALAAAEEQAVPMPLAGIVRDHFLQGIALGYGDQDWSAIARVIAANAGIESTKT